MKISARYLSFLITVLTVLTLSSVASAQAATIGDAIRDTFQSSGFSYDATAELNISKGGKSELPFDFHIQVNDKGGKNARDLGRSGEVKVTLDNLSDVPPEYKELTTVGARFDYRATILNDGAVKYAEITDATLTTDSPEVSKITEMFNQFAKFITGRTFKFSSEEIARMIKAESQTNKLLSEQELLLTALTAGKSIDQVVAAVGVLVDQLVASGVLVDEVTESSARNSRSTGGTTEIHRLRLGDRISATSAAQFDLAFKTFLRSIFPGSVGEVLTGSLDSKKASMAELNEFLQNAGKVGFDLTFVVENGVLKDISFSANLNAIGVPLTITENVVFDYTKPYEILIPKDQKSIIDLNKIFDGFVSIFKATQITATVPSNFDSGRQDAHPGVNNLFDSILLACPDLDDKPCARREASQQLRFARNQYTAKDFAKLRRELNKMVNQQYY